MMEQKPLVSVIMPAYNAEKYIEEAISSVIDQSISEWELLVLDDCSSDRTCQIVEKFCNTDKRVKLIRNKKNLGVAKTRNVGLDLCKGEYIAFLDSDDVWYPEKLEKQIASLKESGADFGYCSYAIIDYEGKMVKSDYVVPEIITYRDLLKENVLGCSTVILSAKVAGEHRFHTDFYHEDYVLWLQLLDKGYIARGCSDVLAKWRYVENSRSFNKWKSAKNRWMIYRKYLRKPLMECFFLFGSYALAGVKKYKVLR